MPKRLKFYPLTPRKASLQGVFILLAFNGIAFRLRGNSPQFRRGEGLGCRRCVCLCEIPVSWGENHVLELLVESHSFKKKVKFGFSPMAEDIHQCLFAALRHQSLYRI